MLILGLLGMYFDAAVVFVTSQTLLLKLAVAILCKSNKFAIINLRGQYLFLLELGSHNLVSTPALYSKNASLSFLESLS